MEQPPRLGDGSRYRILTQLGQGGMGTVWRARDEVLRRDVAVKVLRTRSAHEEEAQARFRREAAVLAGLSHPSIVRIFHADADADPPYFVMELLEGETLSSRLEDEDRLPREAVRTLLGELAEGLACLHERGIVHRDIKPDNLFFMPDGTVRLVDLGLARAADWTALTVEGHIVGTLLYMPPEILRGQGATPRSDVYQAGLVACVAGTGRHPYGREGRDELAMVRSLVVGEGLEANVDDRALGDLAGIVRSCCALDPAKRPADGSALRALLAAPARAARPPAPNTARHDAVATARAPAALIAAVVLGLGLLAWSGREAPPPPEVHALEVEPGPGGFAARWRSEVAYPSRVLVGGRYADDAAVGTTPTTEHRVVVHGLPEDEACSFVVLLPDGRTGLERRLRTLRTALQVVEAAVGPAGDLEVFLSTKADGPTTASFVNRAGVRGELLLQGRSDGVARTVLPAPAEEVLRVVVVAGARPFDLGRVVTDELPGLVERLRALDGRRLTRDLTVGLAMSVDSAVAEARSLTQDVTDPAAEARRQAEDAVRRREGKRLEGRLAAEGLLPAVRRAATLAPLVLGTGLVPRAERATFYGAYSRWLELRHYLAFQLVELPEPAPPCPGAYGVASRSLAVTWPGHPHAVESHHLLTGPPVTLAATAAYAAVPAQRSLEGTATVARVDEVRAAEVYLDLFVDAKAALVLTVNDAGPLIVAPWAGGTDGVTRLLYQRFPVEALVEGTNRFRLAFDGLLGRVTLPRHLILVRRFELRLLRR